MKRIITSSRRVELTDGTVVEGPSWQKLADKVLSDREKEYRNTGKPLGPTWDETNQCWKDTYGNILFNGGPMHPEPRITVTKLDATDPSVAGLFGDAVNDTQAPTPPQGLTFNEYADNAYRTEALPDTDMVYRYARVYSQLVADLKTVATLSAKLDVIKKFLFYGKMPAGEHFRKEFPVIDASNVEEMNPVARAILDKTSVHKPSDFFPDLRTLHGIIGLQTEVGELCECIGLFITGKVENPHNGLVNLLEEAGDVLWYLPILCGGISDYYGTGQQQVFTLDDVARGNIAKLQQRYPDKFEFVAATDRDTQAEMDALMRAADGGCVGTVVAVNPELAKLINPD